MVRGSSPGRGQSHMGRIGEKRTMETYTLLREYIISDKYQMRKIAPGSKDEMIDDYRIDLTNRILKKMEMIY